MVKSSQKPLVSVVVLSYNSKDFLKKFLPDLIKHTPSQFEIVVVDNGSIDDTADFLINHFPTIRRIILKNNVGFADGYVRSLIDIDSKYYCLINADIQVREGWIEPMVELLESNSQVGACQPKIKSFNEPDFFEYAGAGGGYMDKFGYLFCRGRIFYTQEKDQGQYDDNTEIFWASGACILFRSDLYHQVGGFDSEFVSHMEEVDLCWRIINLGHQIKYVPKAEVFHVGGSIISYGSPYKLYFNFRNNLVLLTKNLALNELWWKLPLRSCMDGLAFLLHIKRGEFKLAFTIIQANIHFYLRFAYWYKKRKNSMPNTSNIPTVYQKSIVWRYFVLGKKKFDQLNWRN